MKAEDFIPIFKRCIVDYHQHDFVDQPMNNPFVSNSIQGLMYTKNWIDTVQWHLEDIVRDPEIDPAKGIEIKRRIDQSNQDRTDLVEQIDDWFNAELKAIEPKENARLNTESIAWVVDRISILCLKMYHMEEQVNRTDSSEEHQKKCQLKLAVLEEQEKDLVRSFNELMEDIHAGERVVKVYRQMKMYNDASLNPVLYNQKK